ncbi:hypothetical protein [Streptomyces sp. NPDC007369]|uniref:hypothetical protein n=1 Tax=Streptomyces sp. NPDC007369 TaxID=3154589 RepID=UPI00340068B7
MGSTYTWPRGAEAGDSEELERWLAGHGWEIDPTVFMAGVLGPAVQVRRIDGTCGEDDGGLLILPGETVGFDGERIRVHPRAFASSGAPAQGRAVSTATETRPRRRVCR